MACKSSGVRAPLAPPGHRRSDTLMGKLLYSIPPFLLVHALEHHDAGPLEKALEVNSPELAEPLLRRLDEGNHHGVWLNRLVPDTGDARSVEVRSITGYSRRFSVDDLPRLLLATRVADRVLDAGHGFPARIVAPDWRGFFWWVKWVTSISLDATPWWWQPPFPLQ
jgi:DMSO/TMAO reductase YedYZ molybdopterin-dependent catalytic subunit